jgi:hypothetical protein
MDLNMETEETNEATPFKIHIRGKSSLGTTSSQYNLANNQFYNNFLNNAEIMNLAQPSKERLVEFRKIY